MLAANLTPHNLVASLLQHHSIFVFSTSSIIHQFRNFSRFVLNPFSGNLYRQTTRYLTLRSRGVRPCRNISALAVSISGYFNFDTSSMAGVGEAGLVLGIISSIITIIDVAKQIYEAVEDGSSLPTNFKKSAAKLPLISKLLEDAERYIDNIADESIQGAFMPTLENCKAQATQLRQLFEKVMPDDGDSRWDRYVKAARTIGKGGRVENLVGGILDDLQLLATKFPEVTTPRGREQLATAIEEVAKMEPSLPDGFEQMPMYAHYGSGAQNVNTGEGSQYNNNGTGNQNNGPGQQYIGTNHIGTRSNS